MKRTNPNAINTQSTSWQEPVVKKKKLQEKMLTDQRYILAKNISLYFHYLIRNVPEAFYRHSLIGHGAQVFGMLANLLDPCPAQLDLFASFIGGLLGIVASYASGTYGVIRMLIVSRVGLQLANRFDKLATNNKKAHVSKYLPGTATSVILVSLIFSCIETYLTGEISILIGAIGGAIGSIGLTKFGKRRILKSQTNSLRLTTESQALTLLSFALLGQVLGTFLAIYTYNRYDKYFSRNKLTQFFCKTHNVSRCVTNYPDNYYHWKFWSNTNDTVRLGWTKGQRFFETVCEVTKLTSKTRIVNCDPPIEYRHLPIEP